MAASLGKSQAQSEQLTGNSEPRSRCPAPVPWPVSEGLASALTLATRGLPGWGEEEGTSRKGLGT